MYKNRLFGIPIVLWVSIVALAFSSGTAFAFQAQGVAWGVAKSSKGKFRPGLTPAGDDKVMIKLFAASKEFEETPLLVVFPGCDEDPKAAGRPVWNLERIIIGRAENPEYNTKWVEPEPRWRVCAQNGAVLLRRPGASARIKLRVDFLRPVSENLSPRLRGFVYQVDRDLLRKVRSPERLAQMLAREQPVSDLIVDLYYRTDAERRQWFRGTYGEVFGMGDKPEQPEVRPVTGDYQKMEEELPVVVSDFRRNIPIPYIEEDGGYSLLKDTVGWAREIGSGRAGDQVCSQDDDFAGREIVARDIDLAGTFNLSGTFSTKWTDHSLHPGWGFRVEAWTQEGSAWRMLASDWVQSNGTWSLYVNDAYYTGAHLRMVYRSYNDYYKPQDQNGNTYSWRDPDQYGISESFNAGHRYADCDGGDFNGVGELVDAAMYTWSRLYWIGGIDPVHPPGSPGGPINFHYPNTWNDCVGGSGPPWSCSANGSPDIWLIAAHGTRAQVVTHEMGHQLQNKFWGWKQPAGAGGAHGSGSCYPARLGMALSEGFANFLPGWVGYPNRNVAEGGFATGRWDALELESRNSPPNCANGWENELWVARTFWDLHDTRTDGDDILWFNHRGAVPAIYLANGVASHGDAREMRYYEDIYRAAASAGHQGFITDIFEQNRH